MPSLRVVTPPLAERLRGVTGSPVRDLLALLDRPEVISFAGGLPAAELFDRAGLRSAFDSVLSTDEGRRHLQYAPTEGNRDLRTLVARRMTAQGLETSADDLLVTTGGASVGEHDLVQSALGPEGFALDFWRIAMRPGKPLIWGRLGHTPLLGLPGNPVSALVCGVVFLVPALRRLSGLAGELAPRTMRARLGAALPENDRRFDFLRARLDKASDGETVALPFPVQDSSMMKTLARADALVLRAPHAPPAAAGETVEVIPLDDLGV